LPDVVDVLHISLVCKQWGKLSRDKSLHIWERLLALEGWRIDVASGGGSTASMKSLLDWHKIGRFCAAEQLKWSKFECPTEWSRSMVIFVHEILSAAPKSRYYVHTAPNATPIWYTYSALFAHWLWSPDRDHWMPSSTTIVNGGSWHGCKPVRQNIVLIEWLDLHRPVPHYIQLVVTADKPSGVPPKVTDNEFMTVGEEDDSNFGFDFLNQLNLNNFNNNNNNNNK